MSKEVEDDGPGYYQDIKAFTPGLKRKRKKQLFKKHRRAVKQELLNGKSAGYCDD